MQVLGARCYVLVRESANRGMKRSKRVAEIAVFGIRSAGARRWADVVRVGVVRYGNRAARSIVEPVAVRQRNDAGRQADGKRGGDDGKV